MAGIDGDPDFVSIHEYYAYKLQMRNDDESFLLHFGRLFQQYVVDMYVKLESQRLDYLRTQQEEFRKEFLQGIVNSIGTGEVRAANVGQRVFLPASFIGGPRNMRRRYIDAMTLVQKFGKPDIFLTMTCNPNWLEIKEHLLPTEEAQNRPDLVVRVFCAKLEELKNELLKKNIFGEVVAYTYVIEFQKRGLPHVHFLLMLKPQHKMFIPDEYDKIVSVEIPDKIKYPHLYRMVKKHMMHNPCGVLNPSNVCMTKHGCCKNSYPKEFSEQTIQTLDSYPKYRRRNNGVKIKVRKQKFDNRWVVPHNAYLLAKFNCHINVEICSTIQAVKYIYKYICKGHDRISFLINSDNPNNQIDEIQQYQAAQWVSQPEAVWRLFRFSMGEIKPAIIHLQSHLPNFQPIHFKKHETLNNIVKNPRNKKTMLTEFFYMNRTDSVAQELNCTYAQFLDHFVWLADEKRWEIRDKGDSIGRINTAHPSEGERYYLRLLLSKVRAPKSFEDLITHNGVQVTTFREAVLLRGLLEDDNSQEICLQEASLFHMPYEMRRLFATLLVYSCPNDPKQPWTKFEAVMSEDFMRNTELSAREIKRKVLE
ncbi:uncharacterized protein LOC113751983 [Coffea eugenioides]|uniref:uncharacterized protein LOC113751983 n=1 Tax=Coffea eugenioides TaxID=49369 RepID=UPI000F6144A1|nr:uncharacterized protein LOC113751983 [Coffea eugenioides]